MFARGICPSLVVHSRKVFILEKTFLSVMERRVIPLAGEKYEGHFDEIESADEIRYHFTYSIFINCLNCPIDTFLSDSIILFRIELTC